MQKSKILFLTKSNSLTTTHYIDGFQYSEDKMDFFPTAEGYVNVTYVSGTLGSPPTPTYNYVYNYTDHLGNIRLRYTKNPGTGGGLRILEEDHYYPFGLKHKGYNGEHDIFEPGLPGGDPVVLNPVNPLTGDKYKYKFNGMEWQNEMDINLYDFGARNYDAALGRWMNIDPLAEVSRRWSPYTYAYNNPIYFIDPDGMMSWGHYGSGNSSGFTLTFMDNDKNVIATVNVASLEGTGLEVGWNAFDDGGSAPSPATQLAMPDSGGGGCPDGDCNKGKKWYKEQFEKRLQHKFLKDFTFDDAIWHYRLGDGEPVTVRLNTIDFGDLSVKDFENPDFYHQGHRGKFVKLSNLSSLTGSNRNQALIYGTVDVVYIGQNQIMVLPNKYDFDYKPNSTLSRNIATMLGSLYNWGGTPYYINFQGVTTIND